AWGSVAWPQEIQTVSARLSTSEEAVAIFPWSTYRRYAWNDERVVLDPWNRLLGQRVLGDDRLPLRDEVTVQGEDPDATAVTRALEQREDVTRILRQRGVRWVIVQTDQPAPTGSMPDLPDEP